MTQISFPDVSMPDPLDLMKDLRLLSDVEIDTILKKIREAKGDFALSGITEHDMRCAVYTRRMKATPLRETSEIDTAKAKAKGTKAPAPILNPDDFMG